jgi:hypothetical protein
VRVSRRHGRARLRLEDNEVTLLQSLLDELTAALSGGLADGDEVANRLFPAAYRDDAQAAAEYRALTEDDLRQGRFERIEACRADLERGPDVDLGDDETGRRWIQVLNDLRLALGTRIGVTDDDGPDLTPNDPSAQPWLIYHWLTMTQESVVRALMRG